MSRTLQTRLPAARENQIAQEIARQAIRKLFKLEPARDYRRRLQQVAVDLGCGITAEELHQLVLQAFPRKATEPFGWSTLGTPRAEE